MILPDRIARLPRDRRGYPVPWNALRGVDDAPIFTVNDDRKGWRAFREQLCPICGERLGRWRWFVGGPLSAFDEHGWFLDQSAHHECVRFALQTCPYLAAPRYLGRIDVADPAKLPPEARILLDETQIPERPEVLVAVSGEKIQVQVRGPLIPYTRPSRPFLGYEFWRHGRQITEEEAMPYLRTALGAEWRLPARAA